MHDQRCRRCPVPGAWLAADHLDRRYVLSLVETGHTALLADSLPQAHACPRAKAPKAKRNSAVTAQRQREGDSWKEAIR